MNAEHPRRSSISIDEIVGTYSKTRYSRRLDNIILYVTPEAVLNGEPSVYSCGLMNQALEQAVTGRGFPAELSGIRIIGVSGTKVEGERVPELHLEAQHKEDGHILVKGVAVVSKAITIVSCNDTGRVREVAGDIRESGGVWTIIFTDVRYTNARTGTEAPKDPEGQYVRFLTDNARRGARTTADSVAFVKRHSASYAARYIPHASAAQQRRLTAQVIAKVKTRAPGRRDKTGEPERRPPARRRTPEPESVLPPRGNPTKERWAGAL